MSPKISAPSVREHKSMMFEKLVDSAEDVLRNEGPSALTAGVVAKAAGIARNSIYRYVDSVDDLRVHVLERYIPGWVERLEQAIAEHDEPYERLETLISLSLDIGAEAGHQWMVDVLTVGAGRGKKPEHPATGEEIQARSGAVMNFHQELARNIMELWQELTPEQATINSRMTRSMLDAGLKLLDAGHDLAQVKATSLRVLAALANVD
ncbi:TetR/AcrR family transcriptional regulator [Trueperella bialowiezensis]|uniref:Bacterial regulatory proteins, tetR family n=1 Tax=Trueperella bialowiezensis TaxID=312285 RepID=A0A3S4Z5A6_9ACTO|nr:TetR/AcrR family transcriptional regulator [Trueperella bialowiezensis]VEI13278.1 Bacterial regulatory proteins, tetR family [Trueperella bialowiezensis]